MKKAIKIAIITIGTLLVTLLLTASIAVWIVFTPEKLSPIVNKQLKEYLTCQAQIDEVELTFFSTFPEFGLKIKNLKLIQPMQDAPSDTLLWSSQAIATIDIRALWDKNELVIHKFSLDKVNINAFVDANGKTNFDIIKEDTTQKDTSAFKNPFESIELNQITLKDGKIIYTDLTSKTNAALLGLNADIKFSMKGNNLSAQLLTTSTGTTVKMDSIFYLKNTTLALEIPIEVQLAEQKATLKNARISANNNAITFNGTIQNNSKNGDILSNLQFSSEQLKINSFLALIPAPYSAMLDSISMDGKMLAKGSIKGIYNDLSLPTIDMNIELNEGNFSYPALPYKLSDMKGNADLLLDMNNMPLSFIRINTLKAATGKSTLEAKGLIDQLTEDIRCDLQLKLKLNLAEMKPLLPADMPLAMKGTAQGAGRTKFTLSQLFDLNFKKMLFSGKVRLTDFSGTYDTNNMQTSEAFVDFKLPNNSSKATSFLGLLISAQNLRLAQGNTMQASLSGISLDIATSNMVTSNQPLQVNCSYRAGSALAKMDNLTASLLAPNGKFNLQMDMEDTTAIPVFNCDFDIMKLDANMDTISVNVDAPKGNFTYSPDSQNSKNPLIQLIYQSNKLNAKMGSRIIDTQKLNLNTTIAYDGKQQNALLQWIPKGFITMEQGNIHTPEITSEIKIPHIELNFTPDEYLIKGSKIVIDKSDFELSGKLSNVRQYLKNEALLKGDFDFKSDVTDVNHIMNLTNGIGNEETSPTDNSSTGPFMVPKGMDITLRTTVNKAMFATDTARNVQGTLTVKDGTMVLESMLFTASAAKMQLTALYKTPRKNHLFVGLDFHLLDIEISELLSLIPDIDSIMPMLRSFGGKGEFHIAAETNLDSLYNLKKSTLRGVSSIKGQNLVLMDGETFSEIAKTLRFSKKTVNKVDSLSAEFTIFKQEVDVYPFLIVMDKYKAVVSGRHNLDMNFNYHISVTDSPLPFRLGVDVSGNLDNMKYKPAKCKYANLYRPAARNEIDTKKLEIRKMIREALTKNVPK